MESKTVDIREVEVVQGDVYAYKVKELPKNVKKMERTELGYVIAYGEASGHSHVIEDDTDMFISNDGVMYLKNEKPITLKHVKGGTPTKEHNPVIFEPDIWGIEIVEEYDPFEQEVRKVLD